MKNVVINLYTSSYITRLFLLAILACPTILPENPFRPHTNNSKYSQFLSVILMSLVNKDFGIVDLWI